MSRLERQGLHVLSVTEITDQIKDVLESEPALGDAWVQGEVSNFTHARSGHLYWTLKDADSALRCVMWKGRAESSRHLPEEGAEIVVHGQIGVYKQQGQYNLHVDHVEPVGVGDLYRQYELLKAKLEAEGLFDPERKRPIPTYPGRIGVVTSRDAAALRDICRVIGRRWPSAEVLLAPTLVQGDAAPGGIVSALASAGRASVDVVIVARGGGSIEDLWAFNDEGVARAIAACPVPVVSGVGHETDFTIADFAADSRAATPSAAAETVTPDGRELLLALDERRDRLSRSVIDAIGAQVRAVDQLRHRLALASPRRKLADQRGLLNDRRARLDRALVVSVATARAGLAAARQQLDALSPLRVLERGYGHVTRRTDGRTVASVRDAAPGTGLNVQVSDGTFPAAVEGQPHLIPPEGDAT